MTIEIEIGDKLHRVLNNIVELINNYPTLVVRLFEFICILRTWLLSRIYENYLQLSFCD